MKRPESHRDHTSLLEILKKVERTPDSAFFLNPPQRTRKPSLLFLGAREKLILDTSNFSDFFKEVQFRRNPGQFVVLLLDYEAGYLFSEKFADIRNEMAGKELGTALVFDRVTSTVDMRGMPAGYEALNDRMISSIKFDQTREEYVSNIGLIKKRIEAGDTYQINHTMLGTFSYKHPPSKIFTSILFNQTTDYSAFINTGGKMVLTFSPELFFEQKEEKIKVKPMKGTQKRMPLYNERMHRKIALAHDSKQLAENLMIADLLRNDLHRICIEPVKRVNLFSIERYESVIQMVSHISGVIDPEMNIIELMKALYPCGSITGAPKISSMQIIRDIEKRDRGLYTGTIGLLTARKAVLNVAIRTLVLDPESKKGTAGLGSGIVWDSIPESEFEECLLKGEFFTGPVRHFKIFETMLVVNKQIPLFDHHLERMSNSAKELHFYFDRGLMVEEVMKGCSDLDPAKQYRLKLLLGKYGDMDHFVEELSPLPERIVVGFSETRTESGDSFLYNKTTQRDIYDGERKIACERGLFDLIYQNQSDEITEGGITNIFIRKNHYWYTPPVKCGLLAGIGRKLFMQERGAAEKVLTKQDVLEADEVILTNALRGEIKVDQIID